MMCSVFWTSSAHAPLELEACVVKIVFSIWNEGKYEPDFELNIFQPSDLTWDDFGEDPFSSVMIDASNNQLIKSKSEETYSSAGIGHDKLVVYNFKGTF